MGNSSCTTCSCVDTAAGFVDAGKQLYYRRGLGAGVAGGTLSCTTGITYFPSFSGAYPSLDAAAHL